jgi:hypothetical protein
MALNDIIDQEDICASSTLTWYACFLLEEGRKVKFRKVTGSGDLGCGKKKFTSTPPDSKMRQIPINHSATPVNKSQVAIDQ